MQTLLKIVDYLSLWDLFNTYIQWSMLFACDCCSCQKFWCFSKIWSFKSDAKVGVEKVVLIRSELASWQLYFPQLPSFKHVRHFPKNPWTLQWKGLNLHSRGPGPQISNVWGVRILRVDGILIFWPFCFTLDPDTWRLESPQFWGTRCWAFHESWVELKMVEPPKSCHLRSILSGIVWVLPALPETLQRWMIRRPNCKPHSSAMQWGTSRSTPLKSNFRIPQWFK